MELQSVRGTGSWRCLLFISLQWLEGGFSKLEACCGNVCLYLWCIYKWSRTEMLTSVRCWSLKGLLLCGALLLLIHSWKNKLLWCCYVYECHNHYHSLRWRADAAGPGKSSERCLKILQDAKTSQSRRSPWSTLKVCVHAWYIMHNRPICSLAVLLKPSQFIMTEKCTRWSVASCSYLRPWPIVWNPISCLHWHWNCFWCSWGRWCVSSLIDCRSQVCILRSCWPQTQTSLYALPAAWH